MTKRDTFLKETPPNGKHLFIIITDPNENDEVLCVNIDSFEIKDIEEIDKSCLLPMGCHEFIFKPTFVNYADAISLKTEIIKSELRKKIFITREAVSSQILKLIQDGALVSNAFNKKKFNDFIKYF
jgi:hypothetical protein